MKKNSRFVFFVPFFIVVFFSIIEYGQHRISEEKRSLNDDLFYYGNIISLSIEPFVYDRDMEGISKFISRIKNHYLINSIKIEDFNHNTIFNANFLYPSPSSLDEILSYYFNGDNKINVSVPIYSKEEDLMSFTVENRNIKKVLGYVNLSSYYYLQISYIYTNIAITLGVYLFSIILFFLFYLKENIETSKVLKSIKNTDIKYLNKISNLLEIKDSQSKKIIKEIILKIDTYISNVENNYLESEKKNSYLLDDISNKNKKIELIIENYKNHKKIISSIGHDLRNPIDVIQKTSQIIINTSNLSYKDKVWINRIIRSTSEINLLIKNIMDSSLIDSEQKNTEVDLIYLTTKCTWNAKILNDNPDVFIFSKIDKDLHNYVYLNEEWLSRVISNLMTNSLKFTNKGNISLIINSFIDESGSFLSVSVKDDGYGIPEDSISSVFNEHYSENDSNYNPRGFGIGLYICKNLIEEMGGNIEIVSKVGEGTTISFSIPISIQDKYSPEQKRIQREINKLNMNICMIIENSSMRIAHKSLFDSIGFHCKYFSKISDAIDCDILIGVNIIDYSKENISFLKSRCKRLIALEVGLKNDIRFKKEGIDLVIDKNIMPYDFIRNIISVYKECIISIPRIGIKNNITSDLPNNLLDRLHIPENKILIDTVILVIEDHKDHRETIREILENEGAIVDSTGLYDSAMDYLNSRRYDIIITDFILSDAKKNGLDIAKNISSTNQNKDTSIICCTGNRAMVSNKDDSSRLFSSVLDKPVSHDRLISRILDLKTKKNGIRLV